MHKCWCRIKPTMNEFSSKAKVSYEIVFNIVVIFSFHCRTDSKGCKTEKLEIKVFLFRGDFILVLPLSSLIFLLESKLSHQSLWPWQPHPTRMGGGGRSVSLLLSPAMPCSQHTALEQSWLWGRHWIERDRSQEWQALVSFALYFLLFSQSSLFQGKSGVRD